MTKKFAYLSGAPRVTIKSHAENAAARNHILGVSDAIRNQGYQAEFYILGDRLRKAYSKKGSEKRLKSGKIIRLISDLLRLYFRFSNRKIALRDLSSDLDFCYERFGLFQSIGIAFKKRGIFWILETNAVLSEESSQESKTSYMNKLAAKMEKRAYESCDLLVCVTEKLKSSVVSKFDIDPEKILVMRNAIDPSNYNNVIENSSYQSNSKKLKIMYLGSLTPWCRLELLFEAIGSSGNQNRFSVGVFGDGSDKKRIEKEATNYEVDVDFFGQSSIEHISKKAHEYHIAYCNSVHGNLGSETYGSPMKLYEYMALGLPVLGGKFEDNLQMIKDDVTGYLFNWDSTSEIMESLDKAYENRLNLRKMGMQAKDMVFKHHTWDNRVDILLQKMNSMLASRNLEVDE